MHAHKPIVLIGGAAGVGKTSLARDLSAALPLDHRLGTGFIREIVKTQTTPEQDSELYTFTFRSENPIHHFELQAQRLCTAILACIERARREGTSLVIEGNHLIPSLYHAVPVDLYLILDVPDAQTHYARVHGPTHTRRQVTSQDFARIRELRRWVGDQASQHRIPSLLYHSNLKDIIKMVGSHHD